MVELVRTESSNTDFVELVKLLDEYLAEKDGDEHFFYAQYNKIENIKYVVVAYQNGKPVGCGAIKKFDEYTVEIKRMFIRPDCRRQGIATKVLSELERWGAELSFNKCILETGIMQTEAIQVYSKNGYKMISNYGQYEGKENSICFEKKLSYK